MVSDRGFTVPKTRKGRKECSHWQNSANLSVPWTEPGSRLSELTKCRHSFRVTYCQNWLDSSLCYIEAAIKHVLSFPQPNFFHAHCAVCCAFDLKLFVTNPLFIHIFQNFKNYFSRWPACYTLTVKEEAPLPVHCPQWWLCLPCFSWANRS